MINFIPYSFSLYCAPFIILGCAWIFSKNRHHIAWMRVLRLLVSQLALILVLFKVSYAQQALQSIGDGIETLRAAVQKGTEFIFGFMGGGTPPFMLSGQGSTFSLFFQALPFIIVMSALTMLLFHWRVIPVLIKYMAYAGRWLGGLGGVMSGVTAGKMFLSQIEVAFLAKPYLSQLSSHELFALMTTGMATASAAVIALYSGFICPIFGHAGLFHILSGALINIFSALIIAEILVPQEGKQTESKANTSPYKFVSSAHAIAQGTQDGWNIMCSVAAALLVSVAFIALVNGITTSITQTLIGTPYGIQEIFAPFFIPFAWLMGIPSKELFTAGTLLAEKTLFNEVVALTHLSTMTPGMISSLSVYKLSYGLCTFSNLSSIGLQIITLSGMAPERKEEIARLAPKALGGALLATSLSSALISFFL